MPVLGRTIWGDWIVVVPPSTSLAPADAPARRAVTRSLTPLTVVPSCLAPLEVVCAGSPRSQCPVVAVSMPFGLRSQPWSVSKLSKTTVTGPALSTVTLMVVLLPWLFAASKARDWMVWLLPLARPVVSHEKLYGDVVSVPARAPSIQNSTRVTPTLSVAVAVTLTVPLTVAPLAGAVMDVVGGVVSGVVAVAKIRSSRSL